MIRDIVDRNPRFKQTLGEVTFPANTIIKWKDAWVSVTSVSTSGTRLSPNYFMCTQRGRAILAKVGDKEGQFIEWTRETDKTRTTPDAGVYYLNVDFFSDQTRDLGITVHKYRWVEGKLINAKGTIVNFRPGIDITTVSMSDAATSTPVEFTGFNNSLGAFAYLITPTQQLVCTYNNGQNSPVWSANETYALGTVVTFNTVPYISAATANLGNEPDTSPFYWTAYNVAYPLAGTPLAPLTDFWYQRPDVQAITYPVTKGGSELLGIPSPYISVTFTDQSGYVLRQGMDYTFQGPQFIVLSQFSPQGSTIYANMIVKVNPYNAIGITPENYLQVNLGPNEVLAPNQVFIHTTRGNYTDPIVNADGTLTIPQLLQPGDCMRWNVRIDAGQFLASAKKWELNSLVRVDPTTITYSKPDPTQEGKLVPVPNSWVASADASQRAGVVQTSAGLPLLVNGEQELILPGLRLAIGDNVVVGDQCAIIVSPTLTETYEVFGSKENLTFTLEVKANDLQTASDLSEMLKRELLIMRRANTEADGLTIFEITRSVVGQARDSSATAPSYIYTLSVSASADWKVYIPLVTYLASLEINEVQTQTDFQGKLQMAPRMQALGSAQFIPTYV